MPQGSTTAQEAKRTLGRRASFAPLIGLLCAALCALLLAVPGPAGAATSRSQLGAGASLQRPAQLFSPAGLYWLTLTGSGNAKLWGPNGTWLWASNTAGTHATNLVMQTDGNLVLYTSTNAPVWSSGTSGNAGSVLSLSNTGVLSITSPGGVTLWQTPGGPTGYQMSKLTTNEVLLPAQSLISPSETASVTLAPGGNVTVKKGSTVTFSSNASGFCAADLVMQTDGNLVVYCGGAPLWSTGTSGNPGASAQITDAGQLEVLSAQNSVLWPAAPPPPSTLAQRISKIANSQDQNAKAVTETPAFSNCNPYTAFFNRATAAGCTPGTRAEAWCADFAEWVWLQAGASVAGINAMSYSFLQQGLSNGTLHRPTASYVPQVGQAIVFGTYGGMNGGYGSHVGLVTAVNASLHEFKMTSGNWENAVIQTPWITMDQAKNGAGYPVIGFIDPVPASGAQKAAAFSSAAQASTGTSALSPAAFQALVNSQDQGH